MGAGSKIAIVGSGHVGSHCAMALAFAGIADELVLIDKDGKKAEAQALDVADAVANLPVQTRLRSGGYEDCKDADVVLIAIGEPRLPGQTRLDLLGSSVRMLHELVGKLGPLGLDGIVVTITNPADIVADFVRKRLGLDRSRVFGTGTLLDSARLVRLISLTSGRKMTDISAVAMGEHGDSSMIPFSQIRIGGLPIGAFPQIDKAALLDGTHGAGMDIINWKGSTEFGIGQAAAQVCRTILRDERRTLPLSVLLQGEYGQREVHCGVPAVLGRSGIQSLVQLELEEPEQEALNRSCDIIRRHIAMAAEIVPAHCFQGVAL